MRYDEDLKLYLEGIRVGCIYGVGTGILVTATIIYILCKVYE
jgi:hypothetical protein